MAYWIKLIYDRNTYIVDLDRMSAFCHTPNGRVFFSIFDGNITLVVTQQSDSTTYQAIVDYIEKKTDLSFP